MGLVKRRLYKPERAAARVKHWKPSPGVRLTEAGLSLYEAELGIAAVAYKEGFRVGRVLGYDERGNVFHVVGVRFWDSKPVDAKIPGWRVSQAVIAARVIVGVKRLTREMSGR